MTRPSEVTRERITKAAERLFAERGYDGTSIRAIVAKARVNQAAINYHFDGKDGLYREVLRAAFRAMTEDQLTHAEEVKAMSREEASPGLHPPSIASADGSRRIQPPHADFQLGNGAPDGGVSCTSSARRRRPSWDLPPISCAAFCPMRIRSTLTVASIWLIGQCSVFLRNRDTLAQAPIGLVLDDAAVEWLAAADRPLAGRRPRPRAGLKRQRPARKAGNAAKIPFSRPVAAQNRCLKFNRAFEILETVMQRERDRDDAAELGDAAPGTLVGAILR